MNQGRQKFAHSLTQSKLYTFRQNKTVNIYVISAREKLTVCDVTNLPNMDINWQSISIYGYFVTSLTAYYSCADINQSLTSTKNNNWNSLNKLSDKIINLILTRLNTLPCLVLICFDVSTSYIMKLKYHIIGEKNQNPLSRITTPPSIICRGQSSYQIRQNAIDNEIYQYVLGNWPCWMKLDITEFMISWLNQQILFLVRKSSKLEDTILKWFSKNIC